MTPTLERWDPFVPGKAEQPRRWRKPRHVVVDADLFTNTAEYEAINIFTTMAMAGEHTFEVSTRNVPLMSVRLASKDFWAQVAYQMGLNGIPTNYDQVTQTLRSIDEHQRLPNVWLGARITNQWAADPETMSLLRATPAVVRYANCVPLAGPVTLPLFCGCGCGETVADAPSLGHPAAQHGGGTGLDWLVAGGTDEPRHLPVRIDWLRELRDQCDELAVPFNFRGWGGRSAWRDSQGDIWHQSGDDMMETFETAPFRASHVTRKWGPLQLLGVVDAGRKLDGKTYDEWPR